MTGFALIYDSRDSMNFEPRHRLVKKGLAAKVEKPSRKLRKERKNRAKSKCSLTFYAVAFERRELTTAFYFPPYFLQQRFAVWPRRRARATRRSKQIHLLLLRSFHCHGIHSSCIHQRTFSTTTSLTQNVPVGSQAVYYGLLSFTFTLVP